MPKQYESIVDEPWQQKYYLGKHYIFDGRIYADEIICEVIQISSQKVVESKRFKLNDDYKKKSIAFQLEMQNIYD